MSRRKLINEVGNIYGRLQVVERDVSKKSGTSWTCKCECGNLASVLGGSLRAGKTKSCGCLRREAIAASNCLGKMVDETNNRYGKLVVIKRANNIRRMVAWLCKCDCGKMRVVPGTYLRLGSVTGCHSCWPQQKLKPNGEAALNALYASYRGRAKSKKLQFTLSKDYFKKMTKGKCFYCGVEPIHEIGAGRYNGAYKYNSLDRLDNSDGYTPANCVSCCGICNKMKGTMGYKDFIARIRKIKELHDG